MSTHLPPDTPEGLHILYQMVRDEDRGRVVALALNATNREDTDMGLVPESLDDQYEETEVGGGGGLLPAGEYVGTVLSAEVREGRAPWIDAQLSVKLEVTEGPHAGKSTFGDYEVAPLTDKSGQASAGKLKFIKWQLEALGYTGKLSEIEYNAGNLVGAQVSFEQKVVDYLDANGAPVAVNGREPRINDKSGKPYVDREVVLKENILPGVGAGAPAVPSGQTQSY